MSKELRNAVLAWAKAGMPTHELELRKLVVLAAQECDNELLLPPAIAGMTWYKLDQRRDAWQHYFAYVEAVSPEDAQAMGEKDDCTWTEGTVSEFDKRFIDVYTADGQEQLVEDED